MKKAPPSPQTFIALCARFVCETEKRRLSSAQNKNSKNGTFHEAKRFRFFAYYKFNMNPDSRRMPALIYFAVDRRTA